MASKLQSNPPEQQEEEEEEEAAEEDGEEVRDAPAHHPSAPLDELFDMSTTVDPSYIISLIRKLVPNNTGNDRESCTNGERNGGVEARGPSPASRSQFRDSLECDPDNMDVVDEFDESACRVGGDEDLSRISERPHVSAEVAAWEEYGCVLWDLAASRTQAELMVQNLVLEVLLANLLATQSVRVMEICLGIIGNLACHEDPMKHIVSTDGLTEIIVDQLFLDDTQCLCEACRVLTLGLQGGQCKNWVVALQSEHILCRIMWIAENTLNPQLLEKSVGLLLAILEGQQEALSVLFPSLIKLGLPKLLINLLEFEISRLTGERVPERYSVLDVILRAIEAVSIIDGHSQEICSSKELFQLVCGLVKLPDKVEVANSCVTAAVLIANILSDAPAFASEISNDLPILQGLFDIFPFASDDLEARNALWSVIARFLVQATEKEMNLSNLRQYVLVLVSKLDIIEDDLLDQQLDNSREKSANLSSSGSKSNIRTAAIRRIINILNQWTASKNCLEGDDAMGGCHADDADISRLLDCCCKHIEFTS